MAASDSSDNGCKKEKKKERKAIKTEKEKVTAAFTFIASDKKSATQSRSEREWDSFKISDKSLIIYSSFQKESRDPCA